MISAHFNEVNMNLENLKQKLTPFLEPYNLEVYSIRLKREFGEKIVEILLDVDTMNIDDLEKIHMAYVESLDDKDIADDYYLEISSLGAERSLETIEQVKKQIGEYIYFETNKMKTFATLLEVNEDEDLIKVQVNQKGRIRKIDVKYSETRNMRTAVKV